MNDLNHMYVQYLIEERLNHHPNVRADYRHAATRAPETAPFMSSLLILARQSIRSAHGALQDRSGTPVGTPIATAFLANIKKGMS